MGWPDSCLYWQAISSLIAVQYHCQPLIMAGTALSDTLTPQWCVCMCIFVCVWALVCMHTSTSANYFDVYNVLLFMYIFMSTAKTKWSDFLPSLAGLPLSVQVSQWKERSWKAHLQLYLQSLIACLEMVLMEDYHLRSTLLSTILVPDSNSCWG